MWMQAAAAARAQDSGRDRRGRDGGRGRRRPGRGLLAGLWEYPNELSPAPCPVEAAGLSGGPAGKHIFSHIEWHMTAQIVEAASPELPEGWVWADRADLEREYALPNAFQAFREPVARVVGHF